MRLGVLLAHCELLERVRPVGSAVSEVLRLLAGLFAANRLAKGAFAFRI